MSEPTTGATDPGAEAHPRAAARGEDAPELPRARLAVGEELEALLTGEDVERRVLERHRGRVALDPLGARVARHPRG